MAVQSGTSALTRGCRTKGVGEAEGSGPLERAPLGTASGTQGFEGYFSGGVAGERSGLA
jgi:hypothetical protein